MASLLSTVRDLDRLRQIVGVLVRHGFGEVVRRTGLGQLSPGAKAGGAPQVSVGQRIRLVLTELGPSFVKLGQIVSTRPDLIPEEIIVELKKLQDDVPPEPFEAVKEVIEGELGAPIADLFQDLKEQPLASASIAQVHRARIVVDGTTLEVVAKVQRPQVKKVMERDVELLYWLARAIERSIPESHIYQPVKLVAEFDRAITAELDFTLEADNAERFARNFEGHPKARYPKVYRPWSSRRVITLEFLDGRKVYDALSAGASGETIAKAAVDIIVKQIFEDGFFHADPHPGNVLILGTADPLIGMVDLGLVGHLSPKMRDRTIDLMVAAVREDYRGMADALYAIGRPTKKIDRDAFEAEVTILAQKYLGKKLQDIELSGMLRDLVYGAQKFGLEIPADFLMVGKALMTVEGVGKEIYPELDVFKEVKPYFLRLLQQRYSPEKMSQDVMRGLMRLSGAASDMPVQMQEVLDDLRKGSLKLQVSELSLREAADQLGRRVFSGLIVSALLLAGAVLIGTGQPIVGAIAIVAAAFWTASHLGLLFVLKRWGKRKPP